MVELFSMFWLFALFFGVLGAARGWNKELISLAGVLLATFALFQFDPILRGLLLASIPRDQAFLVQVVLFGLIVYFAYQTRGGGRPERSASRGRLADAIMGGLLGALNGYLIWGAIWWFLDINDYPLEGLISAPAVGSISANTINWIPLVIIGGATGGSGEILTVVVILMFLFVLFML